MKGSSSMNTHMGNIVIDNEVIAQYAGSVAIECFGIVGESGSGKSVTNLSIMNLVQSPPGKIEGGEVLFHGEDLLKMDDKTIRDIRGNKISMIFQDPMTSLDPVFKIGNQMVEMICAHQDVTKEEARKSLNLPLNSFIVMIAGGSQGAVSLNKASLEIIKYFENIDRIIKAVL